MIKEIIFACFCVLLVGIIHKSILHIYPAKYPSKLLIFIGLLIFPFYLMLIFVVPDKLVSEYIRFFNSFSIIRFIVYFVIYLFLFLSYLFAFATIDRSIAWNLLIAIKNNAKKKLTIGQIKDNFTEQIVSRRLRELVEEKYISKEKEYYILTSKGRVFAILGKALKRFIGV